MSFWDTLGSIARLNPATLSFDMSRAFMGDQEARNQIDNYLPSAFNFGGGQQTQMTVLNPDGTVAKQSPTPENHSFGNTLNHIPGYKPAIGLLSYVPNKASQSIATVQLVSDGQSWKNAWDATTADGTDINGVHVANLSGGEALYGSIRAAMRGEGFTRNSALQNKEQTQALLHDTRDSWGGRITSGAITTAATWYADPTLGLGKVAKLSRIGNAVSEGSRTEQAITHAQSIAKGETEIDKGIGRAFSTPGSDEGLFSAHANEAGNRLYKMADSTYQGANPQAFEQIVKRTPDAAPMRILWEMANAIPGREAQNLAKIDIVGAAANSAPSMQRLIKTSPEIAAAQMRLSSSPEGRVAADTLADVFNRQAVQPGVKGDAFRLAAQSHATPQLADELGAYGTHLDKIHRQLQGLAEIGENTPLEGVGLTALDKAKIWSRDKVEREMIFSNGPASATLRVLHWAGSQRFRGSIDIENSQRGNQELMDHLVRTRLFSGEERQQFSQQFMTAETKEQRGRVVSDIHDAMYRKVAAKYPDMTEEAIRGLIRDRNEVHAAGVQYAVTQTEQAAAAGSDRVVLLDAQGDKAYTTVDRATYESHIANNSPLPEPREIEDTIRRTLTGDTYADRLTDATGFVNSAADKFNNAWRLAVLARPGLLVRTQIDSQGRAIAVMGGTAVVSNALKGLGHQFNKVLTHDEEVQLGAVVDDSLLAKRQYAEADHLEYLAARNANIRQQRQGLGLGEDVHPNVLETQNAVLRGEIDPNDLSVPLNVDHIGHFTPEQLTARAKLLRKSGDNLLDTKNWTLKHRLGTSSTVVDVGGHKVTLDPAYVGTQGFNDRRARLYTGNAVPSEAMTMSKHRSVQDLLNDSIADHQGQLYENSNDYRTFDPNHHFWPAAYVRNTDKMRNSYVGRYILQHGDASLRDIVQDLKNDRRAHLEHRKVQGDNPEFEPWLARAIYTVSTVAPTAEIRKALLERGHISPDDARAMFAPSDVAVGEKPARMYIEGPNITSVFPGEKTTKLGDAARYLIHNMGDRPDLAWARHPMFVNGYRNHSVSQMKAWFADHPGIEELPDEVRAHIQNVARHRATKDVQQTMYDTARHTGAHATLRNISPFLGAWEDALVSWSRLFYDDLGRAGAFNKVWNVPNNMGLVVDENGNPVRPGQQSNQSFLVVPTSWDNNFNSAKKFKIRKDSLNSIFQGAQWYTPGTGPALQWPLQEAAAHFFPQVGDSTNPLIKSVLPFGTPKTKGLKDDFEQAVEPTWLRALRSAFSPTDQNNARAYLMSYNQQIIQANLDGKPLPSKAELDKNASAAARNAGLFRMVSSGLLGVTGDKQNVADFYKQQYDLMFQQADQLAKRGLTPTEAFVKAHPEAKGLNWSLTTSSTGVSATLNALSAEKKYAHEININPKYGWFYVGADNVGGEYSQSAYNAQASRTVAGSGKNERALKSRQDIASATLAEQGWSQYDQLNTIINNKLAERGLNSITQKGADDLQTIKSTFIQNLRKENPDWSTALDASNATDAVGNFVNGIAVPAMKDSKLKNRTDIVTMGQYLAVRQQALDSLKAQGLSGTNLSSQAAARLRAVLFQLGESLSAQNLGFQQMWTRVLSHEVDPTGLEIAKAARLKAQVSENG